jgi:hypothetical protein
MICESCNVDKTVTVVYGITLVRYVGPSGRARCRGLQAARDRRMVRRLRRTTTNAAGCVTCRERAA